MDQKEKQQNYDLAKKLLSEQNLSAAIVVGAVASLLAATSYGIATTLWPVSYGFAAAGIGIAVGISMQFLGRGINIKFAVLAALYTIAGCVLGNMVRAAMDLSPGNSASPSDVFRNNSVADLINSTMSYFSLIDLVYWFVAIYLAGFLAKRPLSRADRLAIGMYERTQE